MAPRYHARDAAVMRARMEGALVLLGSATPSAESWHNARTGKYRLLAMPSRIDGAVLPDIAAVDVLEARRQNTMRGSLSIALIDAVAERIGRGEASILLQNRRGYAPHLECRDCAWVEPCPNCSISLTYHKDRNLLRCHYCGATKRLPELCPRCGSSDLELLGAGTQRVEEELREALPAARVIRMDLDSTRRKGAHDLMLTAFGEGEADVLLGTQMVAKGLDFERVTLVGVVSADQSLLLPDFRAAERSFQMLTQVSGRSGRGRARGNVLLQTAHPEHTVLQRVAAHDYAGFIAAELEERRGLSYPPFARLVLVEFSGGQEDRVAAAAKAFARDLAARAPFCRHHQPQPALLARINNRWRYHLLIRVDKADDPDGTRLGATLRALRDTVSARVKGGALRIDIDVDPQQMM
jgi:primosomal protein N' (replication factor Y)